MLKIAVLLSVVVVCTRTYAQGPKLSETFEANCTAELHQNGQTIFGYGAIQRNQDKNQALEVEIYNVTADGKNVFANYRLERLDMKPRAEYYYRGIEGKTGSCSKMDMPDDYKLQPFWDWLEGANRLPNDFVPDEHKNLTYWTKEVSGVRFILGVDKDNNPGVFSRTSALNRLILVFVQYTDDPKKLVASYFNIPPDCDNLNFKKMFQEIVPKRKL